MNAHLNLVMAAFKSESTGVGCDRSVNWATTTAQLTILLKTSYISRGRKAL